MTTAAVPARTPTTGHRPGGASLLGRQVAHELTALRRSPITLILSVGFPLLFFVLLASMVGNETLDARNGVRLAQFLAPGLASFGVVMATFSFLAVGFAEARASGALKRQAATPLPGWVAIGGRIGAAMVLGLIATTLVLGVGAAGYGVQLFWRTIPAVLVTLVLGSLCFAALGLALAALLGSPQTTVAVANGLVIPLSFISDVFMIGTTLPEWMDKLGWFFPLKHMAVLFADALDPYGSGSGFQLDHLLALAAWGLAGAAVATWALRRDTDTVRVSATGRRHPRDLVARTGRPSALALLLGELGHTTTMLRRDASSVFFAVIFPVLLALVIPAANGGGSATMDDGRTLGSLFAATMAAYGAAVTAYVNVPTDLVEGRERGVLKRLHGTPLPSWALLAGRVAGAVVVALLTFVAVFVVAGVAFGVGVPPAWLTSLGVLALGSACLAVLGVAVTSFARTAQAGVGLTLGTLLPLAFISDIFVIGVTFPPVLDAIAGFFPLRPFVRAVVGATSDTGDVNVANLLALLAWLVAGLVVVRLRFSWEPRGAIGGRSAAPRGRRAPAAS
ncbi:ABC transporter permease [Actinotalea sp. M2MS4P-6]|uniref:ABC transporter permease n=1 Tax=Actinotalea sp. M2MS4P-6 TaxID=2983762 RepID=UPI0021E41CE3|nr:ABC transporter permease [Actinotalea sp. M2MS4P-6]MCV2393089.1 ABC transporter permease [Actinotalea sp. M2MS4P-6]